MKRTIVFLAVVAFLALGAFGQATSTKDMKALVAAAQKEGQLTVIALPHDWVNYGEAIQVFHDKYGIAINELNPDGSRATRSRPSRPTKTIPAPRHPTSSTSDSPSDPPRRPTAFSPLQGADLEHDPHSVKDKDGYWYGDYYGALAFEVNADIIKDIPKDWSDLLKPEYKGKVALSGDPRTANQAIMTVVAASLASGGSLTNMDPGLKFFDELNKAGNFVPVIAVPGTVASGETPITIRWDYNALANRDKSAGNPNVSVTLPETGVVAGVYIQAISAFAPHPNAARLWEEFLYSDEGQIIWLKGYGHPARFNDFASQGDPCRRGGQDAPRRRIRESRLPLAR